MDETHSLRTTIGIIERLAGDSIYELLFVVAAATQADSMQIIRETAGTRRFPVRVHVQRMPGLGGALREAFDLAGGELVMLMACDLETDPTDIPRFLEVMQRGHCDIVCGSRWVSGGSWHGYGRGRQFLNWLFQRIVGLLYGSGLTDFTFGYRLYRRGVLTGLPWRETGHPFLLESLLRPLQRGARAAEVPCGWQRRQEGESHSSLRQQLRYLRTAMVVRLFG